MAIFRPEPVLEEVWENETWQTWRQWSRLAKSMRPAHGFRHDADADSATGLFGAWSDRNGQCLISADGTFPNDAADSRVVPGWEWVPGSKWELDSNWYDMGITDLQTDGNGWVYSEGWHDMITKIYQAPHKLRHERPKHPRGTVRRRRWTRTRQPSDWTSKVYQCAVRDGPCGPREGTGGVWCPHEGL